MIFYVPGGRRNTFLDGTQNYLNLTIKNSDTANTLTFDHHGVNVKLGIVQVKLRFHGGSRGKKRVKELLSQVTERVLLVLCFD